MVEKVPPEVEAKYNKLLRLREALAAVAQERASLEALHTEIEGVLSEIQSLPDDVKLYEMVGNILVEKSKGDVVKELSERKEDVELRLKALRSQEDALKKDIEKLTAELQRMLSGGAGAG